jgi:erythronate-4-phosphate dehydrogenase
MKILADAALPGLEDAFPDPFEITLYQNNEEVPSLIKNQDILLCRSTLKVTESLLKHSAVEYVATASSGTDHIDENYLHNQGITLIHAKGSNAAAVADYVIATLAFLTKYKDFTGAQAAIIGAGIVGLAAAERLKTAGLEVVLYDPPKQEEDNYFTSSSLQAVLAADFITIHANLHDLAPYPSRNLINAKLLAKLKPQTIILNTSRGGIVNEHDLLLASKPLTYCTDVYTNEPFINPQIVHFATLCTPHIAGHSLEAKQASVMTVSQKLHAALHLTPPHLALTPVEKTLSPHDNWVDYILSLYNPKFETDLLKAAKDMSLAFLNWRKAHQHRHNFSVYRKCLPDDDKLVQLLGVK